jgi:glycosyltransferase involved in cell wall biosynthesis
MKISVITVCYNAASTIEETIKSVISQNYTDTEYIIIDGGSTDGTISIIEKYKQNIHFFVSEKDNGMYDAINKGIKLATGEIIGLMHADDFFSHNKALSVIADTLNSTKAEAVYSDLQYVYKDNPDKIFRNWKSGKYKNGLFRLGWMPPHPTFYLKKDYFLKYGLYNATFSIAADYELMLRMIHKHKIMPAYIPQVLVKMRVGGKSNISFASRLKANMEDRKAWKINDLKPFPFTFLLKPLRKLVQFI